MASASVSPPPALKAAILVISDTASADPTTDKAAAVLTELFSSTKKELWQVVETKIVPDRAEEIQMAVRSWCDSGTSTSKINLVVTTGGTGFAVKDVTPEAIEPLLERKAPGLV